MRKILLATLIILSGITAQTQVPVISGGIGQTDPDPHDDADGGAATGLGCGGGGANYYGGDGGNGKYGGGGGGASGFGAVNMVGGTGGQGVLVIAFYNGASFLNTIVYSTGSSLTIPAGVTSVKAWAIGAGGGGAGSTNSDGTVGGGVAVLRQPSERSKQATTRQVRAVIARYLSRLLVDRAARSRHVLQKTSVRRDGHP